MEFIYASIIEFSLTWWKLADYKKSSSFLFIYLVVWDILYIATVSSKHS